MHTHVTGWMILDSLTHAHRGTFFISNKKKNLSTSSEVIELQIEVLHASGSILCICYSSVRMRRGKKAGSSHQQ